MLHVSTKLSLAGPTLRKSKTLQVNCSVHCQACGHRVVWIYVNALFFYCKPIKCVSKFNKQWNAKAWSNRLTNLHIVNSDCSRSSRECLTLTGCCPGATLIIKKQFWHWLMNCEELLIKKQLWNWLKSSDKYEILVTSVQKGLSPIGLS